MKSEWIKILDKKELPKGKKVFLCFRNKENEQDFTVGGLFFNSTDGAFVYDFMNDDIVKNIIAYMPFPDTAI